MQKKMAGRAPLLIALICLAVSPALRAADAPPGPPAVTPIPPAEDRAWPGGTMKLEVDASDITHRIIRIRQTIPVAAAGPLVLLSPEWLPGTHAPRGEIEKLAGLMFAADGRPLGWRRDPVNVYAFHIDVPAGTRAITADFQYLAATERDQGRIKIGEAMMNLQWENLSLYPAGYRVSRIPVQARVTFPAGWTDATALRGTRTGNATSYPVTDYATLIDSPIFAGKFIATHDLGKGVRLDIMADNAAEATATPDQIARHRRLVDEAVALFGTRPFDHYDFLLGISDDIGHIGLEHHRSSENGVDTGYFTRWDAGPGGRNILPHEFTHSWNGKYRRPAGLATPDYTTPMQGELLWVYEGQTQFWGYVLGARSGLTSKEQTLDALATIAARLDASKGRTWRPVADTTEDPIIAARRPKAWPDWQRGEDYYNEGMMVWLEADAILRRGTGGSRGLDDFARAFFTGKDGEASVFPYDRQEVVATLNRIMPYDWDGFFTARIDRPAPDLSKAGLELGGYRLDYGDTPGPAVQGREMGQHVIEQPYGIGLTVKDDGIVTGVVWDSAAFRAGMRDGDRILAVGGVEYSRALLLDAIRNATKGGGIELVIRQGRAIKMNRLDYSGGIRYPRLQKIGGGEGSLDRLLKPRL